MKSVDNEDQDKIEENDIEIRKYLADSITAVKQPAGYYFLKRKANPSGDSARIGESATVVRKAFLLNGTAVLSDTFSFPVWTDYATIVGLQLGVRQILTGEKASLFIPFHLGYGSTTVDKIPGYSPIRMEIELLSSLSEPEQIDKYINEKKIRVTERTSDNLVISRLDTLTSAPIGLGKTVNVKYVGRRLDGSKFGEGTVSVMTGSNNTIKGFDLGVQKLPAKGKALLIFPSTIGYGSAGNSDILGYTPLVFEVEVL